MLPLLPLIAGIAAGAAAAHLARPGSPVRKGLGVASQKLRTAASTGLDNVRSTGTQLAGTVTESIHKVQQVLPTVTVTRKKSKVPARRPAGTGPARQAGHQARALARARVQSNDRLLGKPRRGAFYDPEAGTSAHRAIPADNGRIASVGTSPRRSAPHTAKPADALAARRARKRQD